MFHTADKCCRRSEILDRALVAQSESFQDISSISPISSAELSAFLKQHIRTGPVSGCQASGGRFFLPSSCVSTNRVCHASHGIHGNPFHRQSMYEDNAVLILRHTCLVLVTFLYWIFRRRRRPSY